MPLRVYEWAEWGACLTEGGNYRKRRKAESDNTTFWWSVDWWVYFKSFQGWEINNLVNKNLYSIKSAPGLTTFPYTSAHSKVVQRRELGQHYSLTALWLHYCIWLLNRPMRQALLFHHPTNEETEVQGGLSDLPEVLHHYLYDTILHYQNHLL